MSHTATHTISPNKQPAPTGRFTEKPPRIYQFSQALALFVACTGILVVAYSLEPSDTGTGTHTQLGLQPCGFKLATSLPCASCGMTTSFSHMAHGQFFSAFITQPAGSLLALIAAMGTLVGLWAMITGMSLTPIWMSVFKLRWVLLFVGFALVAWLYLLIMEWIA